MTSADRTAKGWHDVATTYDRRILPVTSKYAEEALRIVGVAHGDRVLDVAAGTGALALAAARRGARVTATDWAPAMIDLLRARIAADRVADVEARVMDGQKLELADDSFDAAFILFGLMFFPDRKAGLRELRRVLRPGGKAALTTWSGPDTAPVLGLLRRAAERARVDLPAPPEKPAVFTLADPKRLEAEILEAGFADVAVAPAIHTWDAPTPEEFWVTVDGTSPAFGEVVATLGPEKVARIREAATAIVRAEHGPGPIRIPMKAWLATARKP